MRKGNYGKLSESEWIGGDLNAINPMTADSYVFSCEYKLVEGKKAGFVVSARHKDNYILIEVDHERERIFIYDVNDNAWTNAEPTKTPLGKATGYRTNGCGICTINKLVISVTGNDIDVTLNGRPDVKASDLLPKTHWEPQKNKLMLAGIKADSGCIEVRNIKVTADGNNLTMGSLAVLGRDKWITARNSFELFCPVPCLNLRRKFNVDKDIKSAVLYSSARGFYDAYLNGNKIGDEYYAPGFTDYRLRIDYQKYDITNMLTKGENIISTIVSQGYFSGYAGYISKAGVYGRQNSFIARIDLMYTDGSSETIVSDSDWELAECGPVIYADYLQGEYYDARVEDAPVKWQQCHIVPPPELPTPTNGELAGIEFTMTEQSYPAAREIMRLEGIRTGEFPKGHIIFDMGQNIVGTVRIKLSGNAGDSIKIRYGEMCRKNGEIYVSNLRSAANTDVYILKGDPEGEIFCPTLTSHGFRYVEITGNGVDIHDTAIKIESVTGIVISNVNRVTGDFECSNPLVNKLFSNILWGQRGNYLLLLTDCPQRNERMGWTGDAQVFARTAAYNMDVYEFTRKWLRDLREAQLMYNDNGSVPDIAPLCGDNRGGCGGWADAAVIVPWEMYQAYGDKTVLLENYEMMKAWVEFQNSPARLNNGIRTVDGIAVPEMSDISSAPYIQPQQRRGDHLTFDESTPFILSATAYAAHTAELISKIAEILGKNEDVKKYKALHENIKKAFREAWVQPDGTIAYWGEMSKDGINKTRYSDADDSSHHPSQTAYALAIDFGLIEVNDCVRECFKRTLEERGGTISVGFLGISHLHPALIKCGLIKEAFNLLEQENNPGWLYSVVNGATTIWERWDSYIAETDTFGDASMNSFNHYAYGAIGAWMFGYILGIRPISPGYEKIRLEPYFGGTLKYAKGWHDTPYGRIEAGWRIDGNKFIYKCVIPDSREAELLMPDGKIYNLIGGRHEITCTIMGL